MIKGLLPLLLVLSAPASASKPLPLVDLTDDFTAVWDESASLDEAGRLAAFKARFSTLLPGFYSAERVSAEPAKYDEHLLKGLRAFPTQRAGIEDVSHRFAAMLAPARDSFEAAVGPLGDMPDIYLINSFGEMDGGTRMLGGRSHLVFGADMIAKLHGQHNIQPFFHHELFHVYHGSRFEGCEQVWCGLWTEGLATAAAERLNPGATQAELLLTFPEPLGAAFDDHPIEALCLVSGKLGEDASKSALFIGSKRPNDILPPRIGYFVGYIIASEAIQQASTRLKAEGKSDAHVLADLAQLGPEQVRPLIEKTVATMVDCESR
ncbi:MAG TPA: hypothetical protein VI381_05010 [Allosphingosinicella sp.]